MFLYSWMHDWVFPWILGWYMREQIGNLVFSPKRAALAWAKTLGTRLCHCTRSRLGELVSPERETLSSKRNSLAWARVRSDFWVVHCLEPRSGKNDPPKQDGLSPRLDLPAWARTTAVECLILCFNGWNYVFECENVQLAYYMLGLLLLILWMVKLGEYGLWGDVVELEFQEKFKRVC